MGLRERTRRATMTRVQAVALDLFERRGYDDVSIAEIAAAAEVAERTIYRHFGTKVGIVAVDEIDDLMFGAIADFAAENDLRTAARHAIAAMIDESAVSAEQWDLAFRKLRLIADEPALGGAMHAAVAQMVGGLARSVARARGLPDDDAATLAAVAALIAALQIGLQRALGEGTPDAVMRELAVALDALDRF
ncbi:hypothetical protein GCM10022200_17860 [Microbacterium awajiense]|uniref:HTH tetR-type domain-containing protein n=1 Tax=Microbacterium awajiense TaxID=415214 RepID=A0ABP7AKU2_9MICO